MPYQPIPSDPGELTDRQRRHLDAFVARYTARTRESRRLSERYRASYTDGRVTARFRRLWKDLVYPLTGRRSAGSRVWDVDGNEYVDIAMGYGVHLFGHSPEFLVAALEEQLGRGIELAPRGHLAGAAAELVCELTGMDRAAFCNSGTEAVMATLRAARTVTRRERIALFAGAYHGWFDGTLARSLSSELGGRPVPVAPGVSAAAVGDVLVLPYDRPESLEILRAQAGELAAVLVEPVQSRRPDVQPVDFLRELRALTEQAGTVLIFDEMVTGFRVHPGGVQARFGIRADLATYGKVVGGGMPIGVVAGRAPFMDAFDGGAWRFGDDSYPTTVKTLFGGAFFANPLTMAAACAVLERLKREGPALQERIEQLTTDLAGRLNAFFAASELPLRVAHFGSLFRFLHPGHLKHADLLFYHLVEKGVYFALEVGNCFLST
ncbi:MAG: aspartate aminotransferase family protein, partial [Thermoanaerobaculia bacterium]